MWSGTNEIVRVTLIYYPIGSRNGFSECVGGANVRAGRCSAAPGAYIKFCMCTSCSRRSLSTVSVSVQVRILHFGGKIAGRAIDFDLQ